MGSAAMLPPLHHTARDAHEQKVRDVLVRLREVRGVCARARAGREAVEERAALDGRGGVAQRPQVRGAGGLLHPGLQRKGRWVASSRWLLQSVLPTRRRHLRAVPVLGRVGVVIEELQRQECDVQQRAGGKSVDGRART